MVRRIKQEEYAGILEFEGKAQDNPEFLSWVADHKARNGGKLRISQGGKGVRVMFSKDADMAFWKARSDQAIKAKKASAP